MDVEWGCIAQLGLGSPIWYMVRVMQVSISDSALCAVLSISLPLRLNPQGGRQTDSGKPSAEGG